MWPVQANPEIARNIPRRIYENRFWDEEREEMYFNGIRYNDFLYNQEAFVSPERFVGALKDFCDEVGILVLPDLMRKNYGNGGYDRYGNLRIRINTSISSIEQALVWVHEITHCLAHVEKRMNGKLGFVRSPRPVWEAEAYIVEYRVGSFFFPRISSLETKETYNMRWDYNSRLLHYGPKRNVQMIREAHCVEFADNLILWLIDRLGV